MWRFGEAALGWVMLYLGNLRVRTICAGIVNMGFADG